MRALTLDDGTLSLRQNHPVPTPPLGESLVRVLKSGICNTDIELARGYMAFRGTLGHEFVGVVEESDEAALVGKRVVGEINAGCGGCRGCRAGDPRHCPQRTVLGILGRDGAHADYLTLPTRNLHIVPDEVSDDEAIFVEPLAAACEVLEQVAIRPDDRVVVLGDGKLGLLVAMVVALTGCELHVVGRHAEKLALLGAGSASERVERGAESALPGSWADVAIECTGSAEGFASAFRLLRPRGTLVLKSTYMGNLSLDMSRLVVAETTLVGSRCGPFAPALRLLAAKRINVEPLIHARYPLDDALAAVEHAQRPGVLKVVLDIFDSP